MPEEELEVSTINDTEELELETNLDDSDDIDALREELAQAREAKRQILARAKNAEAKLKSMSSQTTPSEQKPNQPINNPVMTAEDVEVRILKTQKVSDEEIAYLKKIAAINGSSIIEAMEDEVFINFKQKKEAADKSEKARLGVSRGSSSVRKEKEISQPGLTDADHKELWRRQNS